MTIKEILREIPHIRYRLESDRYKDVLNEIEDILKKTSVNPQEPKTEQWQELKETIIELRDNNGMCTQQEVCKFLANLMNVLEKQMQEPKTDKENIHREREQAYMQGYEDACKKYRQEPKTDALDKIRAEIEQMNNIDYVEPVTVDEVLQIIDKYRAESEDKE